MWEKLIKCIRRGGPTKGAKGNACNTVDMADLYKRVPPNQRKQFKEFAKKNEEYKTRLRKYPSKMPAIDWKYYEQNVRKEMVGWVKEFQHKYDQLDSMFANRHTLIDHSKYFGEVTKQSEEVKKEVVKFKEESEKRIVLLESQIKHLKCMKPYTEMTMEEFCYAHPNEAPDFINKPTFWPHTPEEQLPGPSGGVMHGPEPDPNATDDKKATEKDPSKTPPKTPPTATKPDGDKSAKDTKETKPTTPKAEEKPPKDTKVKAEQGPNKESKAVDAVAELASKGVDLAKDLAAKAVVLIRGLFQKDTSKKVSNEKPPVMLASNTARKPKPVDDDKEDSFLSREGSSDICNKTIIRGEDTAKADVKPQHVDLEIEGEQDASPEVEKKVRKCLAKVEEEEKAAKAAAKGEEDECKRKTECEDESEDDRQAKRCVEMIGSESEKKTSSPCEDIKKKKPQDDCPTSELTKTQQKPAEPISNKDKPLILNDNTSSNQMLQRGRLTVQENVPPQVVEPAKLSIPVLEKKTNQPVKKEPIQGLSNASIVSVNKQQPTVSSDGGSGQQKTLNVQEVAKFVFEMASEAAALLSEAKKTIENAQTQQGDSVEAAYKTAEQNVITALAQARKALDSAQLLAKQAVGDDQGALAVIEKHAMLAKLLAHRAITMRKEIAKLLASLKSN